MTEGTNTVAVVPGVLSANRPPEGLRALYTASEWEGFEQGVRRWLGEASATAAADGRVLTLDEALLVPSAYTYAVAAREWMVRLGMDELAARIEPETFTDTDAFEVRS